MYTTIDKFKQALGSDSELLLQGISDAQITEILTQISSVIDAYLMVIYEVPFEANAILEGISLKLAKAEFYRLFARNDMPKAVISSEEKAFKDLEKIQKKELLLKAETAESQNLKFSCKPTYFNRWM